MKIRDTKWWQLQFWKISELLKKVLPCFLLYYFKLHGALDRKHALFCFDIKKGTFFFSCFLNIKMGEEKPQLFCFKTKWTQQTLKQTIFAVSTFTCMYPLHNVQLTLQKREFGNAQYWKRFLTLCKLTRKDSLPKILLSSLKNISVGFSHFKGGLKTIYQKDKNPLTKFLSSLLRVEEEFSWENILSKIRNFLASLLTVPIVKIILFFFS